MNLFNENFKNMIPESAAPAESFKIHRIFRIDSRKSF